MKTSTFSLISDSLSPNRPLPTKCTYDKSGCNGENLSPDLRWSNPPKGTKSFAVTVFDPDAPTGHGWWHWTLVNISKDVNYLVEGASKFKKLPPGSIEGKNDFGSSTYGGACPPQGDKPHRYVFTVHALKTKKIQVNQNTSCKTLAAIIEEHSLGSSSITVTLGR